MWSLACLLQCVGLHAVPTGVLAFVQVHAHSSTKQEPTPPESFAPYAKKAEDSNGVIKMIDLLIADLDKESLM